MTANLSPSVHVCNKSGMMEPNSLSLLKFNLIPWNRVLLEKLIVRSASQEISYLLWNSKVNYRVCNVLPTVPVPSQINPIYNSNHFSRRSILILYSHLRLSLPSHLFLSDFHTTILYAFLISPMHATFLAHKFSQ
jgi:hypothetical protein